MFHGVPAKLICKKHLGGIWYEISKLLGALRKGKKITGHEVDHQIIRWSIYARMMDVYEESKERGYKYKLPSSEAEIAELTGYAQHSLSEDNMPAEIGAYNAMKLAMRCPQCAEKILAHYQDIAGRCKLLQEIELEAMVERGEL